MRLRTEHGQKLRVFQRIERLHECFAWHGQLLAIAQFVAVLRKLIAGRQMVGQGERNGVFAVRARGSVAAAAGNQRAGLRGTAFETDCHRHIELAPTCPMRGVVQRRICCSSLHRQIF